MSLSETTLDAPVVPGGGPRWPGETAARRARSRGWRRWWWTSAALGALGAVLLVVVFLVEDPTDVLLAWFGCWIAAILCMVPAHRTGWSRRHDRYDDELCRYEHGVRAAMSLAGGDGVVRFGDRVVATSSVDERGRRRVELDAGVFSLEERVLSRTADGDVHLLAVRMVGDDDLVVASAYGERRGGRVDWTLDLPLGELRLRQQLAAVPSRRTVLDGAGRAWRIRADVDALSWTAELPGHAGDVDAVFVTWFAGHLDTVGLEQCYGAVGGPALTASDDPTRRLAAPTRWRPVGAPGTRPAVPTASGSGFEIDL
ncbi:hypothetical protein [Actinomycetospora sp. TBRC 11914]|uniref:hypothetical protein n=1 Tax=Actinomycetospora sp. TBRC 11914 TaxID=2729387 RepID=UPI00145F6652|nr:hypothetical protein [Actinomycetospora sp. TBRC 11914]NMO92328.1 hypothetical protein [Actinomycetospora sp. TBRC 11914]